MRKLLLIAAAMFCALTAYAVPVTPIVQPHVTFVNAAGLPCAGCKLYSYTAGTTTPLPTYTDSLGVSQNPNPIILDASGGPQTPSGSSGAIWFGRNSYKLILKDPLGATIWTVDNVNAATLFPCSPANTIQIANAGVNGLNCDSTITIDTINHTLNVGVMNVNHVTIGALSTPTSWFFDTTTPATALASLGGGSINSGTSGQLAWYATTGNAISGTTVLPNGITGTTQSPSDNTNKVATTAYVKTPGVINPTSVQVGSGAAMTDNQGTGVKIQHSTGNPATGNCASYDATGNVVDSGVGCVASSGTNYYFSFTGCTLAVSGNSTNCQGNALFASVTPAVPNQADNSYYLSCTANTGVAWGSSMGINSQSTTGFQFAENVDRYNGISATVTPTVWCHLHHN